MSMLRRRGFTLVELLVVVGIIALLVAMLMPSLQRVFGIARRATCATQLHQQGQAAENFKANNNNWCVKITRNATDADGNTVKMSYAHDLMKYLKDWDLFICPAQEQAYYNSPGNKRLDYGLNHYGHGHPNGSYEAKFYFTTVNNLQAWKAHTGDFVYSADAEADQSPHDIGGGSRYTYEWPIKWSFQRYAYTRHLGGYNWADLRGSVRWHGSAARRPYNEKWFVPKAEHITRTIEAPQLDPTEP